MKGAGFCSLNREVHYIMCSLNRVSGVLGRTYHDGTYLGLGTTIFQGFYRVKFCQIKFLVPQH